jgi:hypothetical protein
MPRKNPGTFQAIAERRFKLRGPASRDVVVRIGLPEPDGPEARCPFQVIGLSNDSVRYAIGVDSFQALNLAFVGVRNSVKNDLRVLSAFHKKTTLTWQGKSWDLALPISVSVFDSQQLSRVDDFLETLWGRLRRAGSRTSRKPQRKRLKAGRVVPHE